MTVDLVVRLLVAGRPFMARAMRTANREDLRRALKRLLESG